MLGISVLGIVKISFYYTYYTYIIPCMFNIDSKVLSIFSLLSKRRAMS